MLDIASATSKLTVDAARSGYGAIDVVKSLSLSVRSGEILVLLGKNGMGKTTLLKTILGLLPLRSGSVHLDDQSTSGLSPNKLIGAGVGYAPQEQPLFQDLSIKDNLRLAVARRQDFAPALERLVQFFPIFAERLTQKAGTLSGGEQKMLVLGRALMLRPRLLLIDEISEGLQPSVVDRIAGVLRNDRQANGTTMLIVEQNLDFALKVADRWAVLKQGEIDDTGNMSPQARDTILGHLKI
ncbi:ABC transporter ATP-binding protein [Devosia sp. SL43]|uniref:ABC transporter ATP-binding protein n=1 Tax=Devosia sp. SL43 TaxID=2806348 RepID=UPI001F1F32B6|nr:ABC transporter ATP-binding protein [Devosia sp. SL43]UJW84871.1 ABC transporter ATP-binding protein [Devosia sp. SL43]